MISLETVVSVLHPVVVTIKDLKNKVESNSIGLDILNEYDD